MKTTLASILCVLPGYVFAQGSLTPPGAPAPLFKTLQQVEPRTPISTFFTIITNSGSFYLTTNLVNAGDSNDGIFIRSNAANVTIDLNGFSIISTGVASNVSPAAFRIDGATNITIRNGRIFGFDRAVRAQAAFSSVLIEDIFASGCHRAGIEANGLNFGSSPSPTMTVRRCVVENVDATGEAASAPADGIGILNAIGVVDSCVVRNIIAAGASASTCINCTSATNTFINNNFLSGADTGLRISGGTSTNYYRNNLTADCPTPFSVDTHGVDRGGNF